MADQISEVRRDDTRDTAGMSAFMIIVLFVALLAFGAFVYFAVNDGAASQQNVIPQDELDVNFGGDIRAPGMAP